VNDTPRPVDADLDDRLAPTRRPFAVPDPVFVGVFRSLIGWAWFFARLELWSRVRSWRGPPPTPDEEALKVAALLERMSGAQRSVARTVAGRLDVFPVGIATALARLEDPRPPPDLDATLATVAQAAGMPLEQAYARIDPEPLQSDTVFTTYQAELADGTRVAIKVLRDDALLLVNTERVALQWLFRLFALLSPFYAHIFRHLVDEAPADVLPQFDLIRTARVQTLLRRRLKKDKLASRATTTRVFQDLSDERVLVNAFASGVWLHEVLATREQDAPAARAALRQLQIDPDTVARNLFELGFWMVLENHFQVAAPRMNQVVVQRGGRIVLLDVGMALSMPFRQQEVLRVAMDRLVRDDVEGAVDLLAQLLYPLPPIDVHELLKQAEQALWVQTLAARNADAPWWQRGGMGIWVALLEVARNKGVVATLEVNRALHCLCVYGGLTARLRPRARLIREYSRYEKRALRRRARTAARRAVGLDPTTATSVDVRPTELLQLLETARLQLDEASERLPLSYLAMTSKTSFMWLQLGRTLSLLLAFTAVGTVPAALSAWRADRPVDVLSAFNAVITHPLYLAVVAVLFWIMARHLLMRLDDIDR
jgi:predicted unusual protein kinase regulating ubiquinone biosynthesis (AarF/ABC1/UbiB family)